MRVITKDTFNKRIKKYPVLIKTIWESGIIILLCIGLAYILPTSLATKENVERWQILKQMIEMDNIMHQQDRKLHTFSGYNPKRDRIYHIADNKYHTEQYGNDKLKAAEKLHSLMIDQNRLLQQIGQ
jgi:hypothetical protein